MDLDNSYGTLDMQTSLLELLKEFHKFCMANNIKYSLDWGSLLGAIRHKGFIPWDDDLDIMVDRENYEKIKRQIGGKLCYEHGTPEALWIDRVRLVTDSQSSLLPTTLSWKTRIPYSVSRNGQPFTDILTGRISPLSGVRRSSSPLRKKPRCISSGCRGNAGWRKSIGHMTAPPFRAGPIR